MFSRSVFVLFLACVSLLLSTPAKAEEADLDRIQRLERIAADLGALGMSGEAAKYQSKATNERASRERQAKAIANAMNSSRLLTNQIGQFQNALNSGKFGKTELQGAARKLIEKHRQLGKFLAILEFASPAPAGQGFVATTTNWEAFPAETSEIVPTPQTTVVTTPTLQTNVQPVVVASPAVQTTSQPSDAAEVTEFPGEFTEENPFE